MHIAFHIGRIHEKEPGATFLILSRDTDFDPLIEYLKAKGVEIARSKDVGALAKPRPTPAAVPAMGAVPRKGRQTQVSSRKAQPQKPPQSQKAPQPQKLAPPQKLPQAPKVHQPKIGPQAHKPQHAARVQPQKSSPPQKTQPERRVEPAHFDQIVKQLRSMSGKPKTRKRLEQTIASYFKHHGGERPELVQQTIDELVRSGIVAQAGTKVSYQLD